jgi:hypothetical protein
MHYLIKSIQTLLCSSKLMPRCHYDDTYRYKRRQKAVYCLLLSSTSSMDRSGEPSDFECGLVIGCHISKKSVRDITTLLKSPKSVAGDMIVKWKHEGTTTMKPRPEQRPSSIEEGGSWNSPDIKWIICPWVPQGYELSSQHHDYALRVKRNGVPWASSCP